VIWQRVHAESTRPRLVVLDLSAARVDLQSAEALGQIWRQKLLPKISGFRQSNHGPRSATDFATKVWIENLAV
jgi:hypothetical protein